MANNNNFPAIRQQLTSPDMLKIVQERIGEKAGTFMSSVLDLIGSDNYLMQCDPRLVVKEALKAAALDLPVSKSLGFAYVIPYKSKGQPIPNFQLGYRGLIQLAIRSGQFRHLNTGVVYEGEHIIEDRIKGTLEISGEKTSESAVGYYAYMQLVNGFEKAIVWSRERVESHAKKFSKAFGSGPWQSDFDAMAKKTVLLQLKTYMPMSIEMQTAMIHEAAGGPSFDAQTRIEIDENANSETIDIPAEPEAAGSDGLTEAEKAEIQAQEAAEAEEQVRAQMENGPGF